MAKRTKYTQAEKTAYKTGKAYRLGRDGKAIPFKNENMRQSFSAGYAAGAKTKYKTISK